MQAYLGYMNLRHYNPKNNKADKDEELDRLSYLSSLLTSFQS